MRKTETVNRGGRQKNTKRQANDSSGAAKDMISFSWLTLRQANRLVEPMKVAWYVCRIWQATWGGHHDSELRSTFLWVAVMYTIGRTSIQKTDAGPYYVIII
eukprot:scaffold2904_cov173-Amphora_coffeaeformis.AAC.4